MLRRRRCHRQNKMPDLNLIPTKEQLALHVTEQYIGNMSIITETVLTAETQAKNQEPTTMKQIQLIVGSRGRYSRVIVDGTPINNVQRAVLDVNVHEPTKLTLTCLQLHEQEPYEIEGYFIEKSEKVYTAGEIESLVMDAMKNAKGDWHTAYVNVMCELDKRRNAEPVLVK